MPDLYIISGPNGAGKTTTAMRVFPSLGVTHFINADMIAQGISPLDVDSAARAAGRLMLEEMEECLANKGDFALETTLASRTLASFVKRCKEADYRFILIYVWLQSADLAVERVAKRVRAGGHNIPEETIRRRYERGRANFFSLYKDMADEWVVFDNTSPQPVTVASMNDGQMEILQPQTWEIISRGEL
ncbi:Zeta toxin family protein [bacterium]|nr:MAG: Zeta toxin family protein [bacterium]